MYDILFWQLIAFTSFGTDLSPDFHDIVKLQKN